MDQEHELKKLQAELDVLKVKQEQLIMETEKFRQRLEVSLNPNAFSVKPSMPKPAANMPVAGSPEPVKQSSGEKNTVARLERFIGVNLVSFSGIVILLAGVGIGINYAIQHGLMAPIVRFILGYLAGFLLLGAGHRVLMRFRFYAAILLNGGIAVLYFNTYAAAGYYNFFPQELAFGIMLLLTVATVSLSLWLDNQYTAIIGLVGAYGIPFLVGSESGAYWVLPTYTILVNLGILYIGFRKNWRVLNYSAFGISWLLFMVWVNIRGAEHSQLLTSLALFTLLFLLFYMLVLGYKLIKNEAFKIGEVVVLLLNSFFYFVFSLALVKQVGDYTGIFTAFNAALHGLVILLVHQRKIADRAFYYFLFGLFLSFLTLSIPMQFDGQWVCWLWALEGLALYAAGSREKQVFYTWTSFALMIFASLALLFVWQHNYMLFPGQDVSQLTPLFNQAFAGSLVVCFSFACLYFLSYSWETGLQRVFRVLWLVAFFALLYLSLRNEISHYWFSNYSFSSYDEGSLDTSVDEQALHFRSISLFLYTVLFLAGLSLIGRRRNWAPPVKLVISLLAALSLIKFAAVCLQALDSLRPMFSIGEETPLHVSSFLLHALRYLCYGGAAFLLFLVNRLVFTFEKERVIKGTLTLLTHFFVLFLLSYELTILASEAGAEYNGPGIHKAGFSILWGCYALYMVASGFLRGHSLTRFTGVVLVLLVACKLLLYDLSGLSSGLRILLLITLGILMLIIAFVYQKYAGGKKIEKEEQTG